MWADPRIIELAKQFVPATDEVWRLGNAKAADCRLFQKMTDGIRINGRHETKQGTYVCTPSGRLLSCANSNSAARMLAVMEEGLQKWHDSSQADRQLPLEDFQPKARWEDRYPQDGLVLWMTTRDMPNSRDPSDTVAKKWNQDAVWFTAEEAAQWLPPNRDSKEAYQIPKQLAYRLARFHIVDTAKGQTSSFADEHVAGTEITGRAIDRADDLLHLEFEGTTRSESMHDGHRNSPHGIETEVRGSARFDLNSRRFLEFELVALGERWGRTRFNGRRGQLERSPVGFVFQRATPETPNIVPAFIYLYGGPWPELQP